MPHKDPEAYRAYHKAYAAAHREKLTAQHRQWQLAHAAELRLYRQRHHAKRLATDLAGVRAEQRAAWLARRYGLTDLEFNAMLLAHDHRCAICGTTDDGAALHIDHNHATGVVRGLLCGNCNRGVGLFRDDPSVIDRAAAYLRRFEENADDAPGA